MKYYEIVLYSSHAVQRICYLPEDEAMRFKKWLLDDNSSNAYEMTFESSPVKSKTKSCIVFKNILMNVDFDIRRDLE